MDNNSLTTWGKIKDSEEREREAKVFAEAKASGRNIEKLPEKAQF